MPREFHRLLLPTGAALTLSVFCLIAWAEPEANNKPAQTQPAAKDKRSADAFKPVMTVETMMDAQQKLYGELKMAIADKSWIEAERLGWLLAEVANVNQYHSDESDYRAFAKTMSERSIDLTKAVRKRDAEAAKSAAGLISKSCKACHKQYKKN